MRSPSSFRFALASAALLGAGCGNILDERHSSGGASGSGGDPTSTGVGGASVTSGSSGSTGGGNVSCPSTAWSHAYESALGSTSGDGIAVDASCNVYVTGLAFGTLD